MSFFIDLSEPVFLLQKTILKFFTAFFVPGKELWTRVRFFTRVS